MKKNVLFMAMILGLIMCSCKTVYNPKYSVAEYYTDYSRYAAEGLFITEAPTVPFDYSPIGSIAVEELSGYQERETVKKKSVSFSGSEGDPIYDNKKSESEGSKKYQWVKATPAAVTEAFVELAKAKGADGVMNFQIKPLTHYSPESASFTTHGFQASGMLFKRKK